MVHFLKVCSFIGTMGCFFDHMRGKIFNFGQSTLVGFRFASAGPFIEMVFLLQLFLNILTGFLDELFSICKILIDDLLAFVLGCHVFFDVIVIKILPPLNSFRLKGFIFRLTVFAIINYNLPIACLCILYGGVMREYIVYSFS